MTENKSMISTVFKTLTEQQREELLIAFNDGVHYLVKFDGKTFLGVNITDETGLEVIETHNNWYFGCLK